MTPSRGRSQKSTRLIAEAPFGKWNTQTFIADLRCDELVAPWVIEGAIDGEVFNTYVCTQFTPQLKTLLKKTNARTYEDLWTIEFSHVNMEADRFRVGFVN